MNRLKLLTERIANKVKKQQCHYCLWWYRNRVGVVDINGSWFCDAACASAHCRGDGDLLKNLFGGNL